jgi:RimJ/RimL family protein N-acetyltransferase
MDARMRGDDKMESVYLRALELSDLERTYKWHNDPGLNLMLGSPFFYVSHATEEEWLRKKQAYSPQEVNLAICLTENSQHIGNFYMRDIDWVSRHAELHILIGEPVQRLKGYGQVALRLLVRYAFQDLGLVRLWALFFKENEASHRILDKCGFVEEGLLRKHVYKAGQFKDVIIMGLCASDLPAEG